MNTVSAAVALGHTEAELRKQAQRAGEVPGLFHCYLTRSGRIFKAEEIKRPQRLNGLLPSQDRLPIKETTRTSLLSALLYN